MLEEKKKKKKNFFKKLHTSYIKKLMYVYTENYSNARIYWILGGPVIFH